MVFMMRACGSTVRTQWPSSGPPWRWKYHQRLDLIGLDGEDDEVLRTGQADVVRRGHVRRQMLAAVVEDQPQAAPPYRGEMRPARNHRHRVPGFGEQHCDVPANRSRTHHTNLHIPHH
jgi:hypothetical protein